VVRELDAIAATRGYPASVVSDNGTELTSSAVLAWSQDRNVGWAAPRHHVPRFVVNLNAELSPMHTTHIAVDTSKTVFTLHASDAIGHCTGRFDLKRAKFLAYFEKQPSLTVTLEA
jgi:hypothetical protein